MKLFRIMVLFTAIALLVPALSYAESDLSWLSISGDYQGRYDALKGDVHDYVDFGAMQQVWAPFVGQNFFALTPAEQATLMSAGATNGYTVKNDALLTNRFRLNLKARATENIQVKARLVMYKIWGNQNADSVNAGYFADRSFIFDGVTGHVPQDNVLRVDTAYATWSNVFELPVWFSVGRRPSTGGIPNNIKHNEEKQGTAGIPGLLVDYAFDGLTVGFAPYVEMLPGAYAKVCYGKGTDTGYRGAPGSNTPQDTDMLGVNLVPYDGDNLHVEVQWNRAFNLFDNPNQPTANLGDIDQYGTVVMGKIGNLNLFASGAISQTHASNETYNMDIVTMDQGTGDIIVVNNAPLGGLLYDGTDKKNHSGYAYYVGGRYDIDSIGTKIGAEYNHGSQYWITFAPAADDMWTSKLGTRGDVFEVYLIQEIKDNPVSKNGKAFFRLGYQYYKFAYTGSNNWIGKPKDIDDLTDPSNAQFMAPIEKAHDIYLTFNVTF